MAKRPAAKSAKTPPPTLADAGLVDQAVGTPAQASAARPLSLDSLLGQKRAVDTLRSAITTGRVHHAWVFGGPQGVGKFHAACGFAAELLMDNGPLRENTRHLLHNGTHPDLHVVTKELAEHSDSKSVRTSKQTTIAKLVVDEFLIHPAHRSRVIDADSLAAKVFIIDEAELLNHHSQNALLKLLEEPPLGTVFCLLTTEEHGLLPTIRSRCQRVPFSPLDSTALQVWMSTAAFNAEGPERDWLIAYGNGSPGHIATAHKAGLYEWHVKLDRMLTALGSPTPGAGTGPLGSTMNALVEERAKAVVEENAQASKDTANRRWAQRMLAFVAERLRRQMIGAARARQSEQAAALADALDAVSAAEAYLDRNVRYDAVLDNLVAQIAAGRAGMSVLNAR